MQLLTDPPLALTDDEAVVSAALATITPPGPAIVAGDSESDLAQTVRRLASYRSIAVRFVAPIPQSTTEPAPALESSRRKG